MSYPKKILRLLPTGGLALDIPASEASLNFYTGGSNVVSRDGFMQRVAGSRGVYAQSTPDPVLHLLNVRAPGGITESNFWLVFGADEIQALETSNIDDITGAALTPVSSPFEWCSTLLNNLPCVTNGLDAPRYWAGDVGTGFTDLPGWPAGTICKSMVAFKYHLFAFDIDGPSGHFESQLLWSDAAVPGSVPSTWTADPTNEAGDTILADTPGPIMCGAPLAGSLLIFKRSSTYAADYSQDENVFRFRTLDAARGALTRRAVCDIGGRLFVVGDGDVWITDGTNWQSVATARVRRYLFSQLDQASYENLFVVYNRARNEVWVCSPTTGNTYASEALIYDVATDAWGIRPLANYTHAAVGIVNDTAPDESWDVDSDTWDPDLSRWNSANFSLAVEQLVSAHDDADLTAEDTDDSVILDATLYRHDLTMGEPERFKYVRRIHQRMGGSGGTVYLRIGTKARINDAVTWTTEVPLTDAESFINVGVQGRFISIELRSEDSEVWQAHGTDLEYEMRGYL